jgi:hypothetical protein
VAVVLVGINATNTQYLRASADEVATVSFAQSGGLEVILADCKAVLRTLKNTEEIVQTASGNYHEVIDDVSALFGSFKINPNLLNIIITDHNGYIRIGSNAGAVTLGDRLAQFEHAERLTKGETYLSNITAGDTSYGGQNTFYVLGRIDTDDVLAGYVCLVFSVDVFTSHLQNSGFFEYGYLFVTDREGTALWLNSSYITALREIPSVPLRTVITNAISQQRSLGDKMEIIESSAYIGSYGQIGSGSGHWFWFGTFPTDRTASFPFPVIVLICMVFICTGVCLIFMLSIVRRIYLRSI